jgi:hypothetical protein
MPGNERFDHVRVASQFVFVSKPGPLEPRLPAADVVPAALLAPAIAALPPCPGPPEDDPVEPAEDNAPPPPALLALTALLPHANVAAANAIAVWLATLLGAQLRSESPIERGGIITGSVA